ncbi:MAG: hypothetical protein Q9222_004841 [Ikaeria aurantiellina]
MRDSLKGTKRSNRVLRAARVEAEFGKRDIGQALRCEHKLHYVDDFGKFDETYRTSLTRNNKRQIDSAGTTSVVATGASPSTAPISFPVPPSATPTATGTHQDVSFSYIDTPILPPQFPGVDSVTLHAPIV